MISKQVMILNSCDSILLREIYKLTFLDTSKPYFEENIINTIDCNGFACYKGYLWDYLKKRKVVSQKYIIEYLYNIDSTIYAFWDIHSEQNIRIPDYWKYPKDSVIQFPSSCLLSVLPSLPEDVYFFDDTLLWTAIFTHEEIKQGKPLCFITS